MTDQSLLDEFINEECISSVREMLLAEIRECHGTNVVRTHTFNRFNLKIEFAAFSVQIEDDLDPGEEGEMRLGLEEFEQRLQSER